MAIELVLDTVEFPCIPWVMRGMEILPQTGTWTPAPEPVVRRLGIKGILSCPRCAHVCGISDELGAKGEDNPSTLVLKQWHCDNCHLQRRVILNEWDKRKLYCAAFECMIGGVLTPCKEYMHAESDQDALAQFWNGRTASDNVVRLVAVAPVIGYFVQDTTGRKLNVD